MNLCVTDGGTFYCLPSSIIYGFSGTSNSWYIILKPYVGGIYSYKGSSPATITSKDRTTTENKVRARCVSNETTCLKTGSWYDSYHYTRVRSFWTPYKNSDESDAYA